MTLDKVDQVAGSRGHRVAAERNLSALAFLLLEAMAHDWRVELVLDTGTRLKGRPLSVEEDLARKGDSTRKDGTGSHLIFVFDTDPVVRLDRVREVLPAL